MKQLYSITRTDFYKSLLKNKQWQVERTMLTSNHEVYVYGCNLRRGQEIIIINPLIHCKGRRLFEVTYKPHPSAVGENKSNVDMKSVTAFVNKKMYDTKPCYNIN